MMYQFSSKRLFVLLICFVALGTLTFTAGLLTGLGLAMPTREEIAMLKASKAPKLAVAEGPPHLPSAPVAVPPHLPAAVPQAAAPAPPKTEPAVPPAVQPASPAAQNPVAAPASEPAAPPVVVAPAPTMAASQPEQNVFSLQLGSFRDLNHAKQLQSDMKDRGYATSILTALDSDQREWHVVRIDGFKTLASASQAAAEFIGKERIPAVVRRSKSL